MSRGILKKIDMEAFVYQLKNDLNKDFSGDRNLANKYLDKILDKLKEFRE